MRDKAWRLGSEHLGRLISLLTEQGYEVLGPRIEGTAVRWGPTGSLKDLPAGTGVDSAPGHYRLREHAGPELFASGPSPDSLKRWLHVPEERFVHAVKEDGNGAFRILPDVPPQTLRNGSVAPRFAFLGFRPCDLAALARLDRVFLEGPHIEEHYSARRRGALF